MESESEPTRPFFSVVIASRNRPHLLRLAVESVIDQSFQDFEIILVNDGSEDVALPALATLQADYPERLRRIDLVPYRRGHGPSYALNTGAFAATGSYVTFLDDDDCWTDPEHLQKAQQALLEHPQADVYYTNQRAVAAGQSPQQGRVLWLGELEALCRQTNLRRQAGVYCVEVSLLMRCGGFAHLNCSVLRRELFEQIGGMDEDIRWEGDRDFYLRTLDAAGTILFNPDVVAEHHIPDPKTQANVTTATSTYQRLNNQLYLLNKTLLLLRHPALKQHARKHRLYTLQKIAENLYREGRYAEALDYCREALLMGLSARWPGFCLKLLWRRWLVGDAGKACERRTGPSQ